MADEEGAPYQFTPEGAETRNSSRDYTGEGYALYPNSAAYFGSYLNGVRQGKGKYLYRNGARYEGDLVNNKKHGVGKLSYKDKGDYFGEWAKGVKHGAGTYTYIYQDTISG